MDNDTVFTKTARGITQVNQRSASLPKELMKVLRLVDGKSTLAQIMSRAELDKPALEKAMNTLINDGFARVFATSSAPIDFGDDDFDFTTPGKLPGTARQVVAVAALDITELARQQEQAEAERKAREDAQAAARDRARRQAEARATVQAEARAKAEAEMRAMEQARNAREAADRAKAKLEARVREEEARKRLLAEQLARAEAEERVKQEQEDRRIAQLRAKAHVEADDRARAEIEAKVREEEATKRRLAEATARAAAEQQASQEAERQRFAEARAKAEAEARSLAEARQRAEMAAQALSKAREEAEAVVWRQARVAAASEQELRARVKEDVEISVRNEIESLLRDEIEEKARAEVRAQIMQEARLAARAELEERLREEYAALNEAERQARVQAERIARDRIEQEAKLREAAEARAVAEAAAREKAEEEARKLRLLEASAREVAQAAEREKAEVASVAAGERAAAAARLELERQAKIEAELRANAEVEERERREAELAVMIEAERRARDEAEVRARIEARARESAEETTRVKVMAEIEGDMSRRAELEGKAQARAFIEARQQAELDEEARIRLEQERRAREIADVMRIKVAAPAEGAAAPAARRSRDKVHWARNVGTALGATLVIGLILLHLVPLRGFADRLEKGIGGWLHDQVSISSLKFSLFPSPHLKLEGFTVGKALDVKATSGRVYIDITALLNDRVAVTLLDLEDVSIAGDATRRVLSWGKVEGKGAAAAIEAVSLRNVKLDVKPVLKPFDVSLSFRPGGAFRSARLAGENKWSATIEPRGPLFDVTFKARHWEIPAGTPLPTGELSARGVLTADDITFPAIEADLFEGKVNGTLKVTWKPSLALAAELSLARVRADPLVAVFTRDIVVTGRLEGSFTVAAEAAGLATLADRPRVQGRFRLTDGSVSNADLVSAMQSSSASPRGGVTKFAELTGEFQAGDGRTAYRNLGLQGGVLRGSGNLDIAGGGALSGRIAAEIRSNVAQDRGAFAVSGTIARPVLRRGG